MKILLVNVVCGIRSTGRICAELAEQLEKDGHEVKIAYGREEVPERYQKYAVRIGGGWDQKVHALRTRVFDEHGFCSKKATKEFLEWAERYNPDTLWLHNIHGYYINVEMLFEWIKQRPKMQVKWTLHDCWAFTGHCAYFTMAGCEKWKEKCEKCVQKKKYPASMFKDNSKMNFERKRKVFTGVSNMTLITPSKWLADLVKESFLKEYPVEVHYNTVDTEVFKPTQGDFREKYNLTDKKIILGVASVWDERKGLQDFFRLAEMLDDSYVIVLVGLTKRQIESIPKRMKGFRLVSGVKDGFAVYKAVDVHVKLQQEENGKTEYTAIQRKNGVGIPKGVSYLYKEILGNKNPKENSICASLICIPRTDSVTELAEIYTAADYFVNPTYEDNYPTVNLEAVACGTKVITYLTGGSLETLGEEEF